MAENKEELYGESKDIPDNERILCAAIHYNDEKDYDLETRGIETGIVFCGWRHGSIFPQIRALGLDRLLSENATQGFLTSRNRFVSREEAAVIALKARQISKEIQKLYSEDLY